MKITATLWYKHIEYIERDGRIFKVCRPFKIDAYLVPIDSLDAELERDKALGRQKPFPLFPSVNDTDDPDDLRDYYEQPPFDRNRINFSEE